MSIFPKRLLAAPAPTVASQNFTDACRGSRDGPSQNLAFVRWRIRLARVYVENADHT